MAPICVQNKTKNALQIMSLAAYTSETNNRKLNEDLTTVKLVIKNVYQLLVQEKTNEATTVYIVAGKTRPRNATIVSSTTYN